MLLVLMIHWRDRRGHTFTGFTELDYWAGRRTKPSDLSIAGIHLMDSTRALGDKRIREDSKLFGSLGVVLSTPSLASPERSFLISCTITAFRIKNTVCRSLGFEAC